MLKELTMEINLIVAQSTNRVIGKDNTLPWHLSGDLKRFKQLTMGHFILMGRKTFESIGKPLPGRTSVVVTRNKDWSAEGVRVVHSLEEGFRLPREAGAKTVFVLGGAEIFGQTLPIADRLYLTQVHAQVEGDTFFPPLNLTEWHELQRQDVQPGAKDDFPYSFIDYKRLK